MSEWRATILIWVPACVHIMSEHHPSMYVAACVCVRGGGFKAWYFYIVCKERPEARQWAQTNGQSGKREETLPMGQPRREDILPMGQCRERTGKIHIGPSALPRLYSDKIFKSSHYFTLGHSVEMPGRKPQNVYMPVHTQFWCIDSYIKMSSSH